MVRGRGYTKHNFLYRLCAANNHPDLIGCLETGNYQYCQAPIKTGDHHGNHFKITIREVKGDDDNVAMAMKSASERGFVNYFGPQRFGGGRTSAAVALAMLKTDYVSGRGSECGHSISVPTEKSCGSHSHINCR